MIRTLLAALAVVILTAAPARADTGPFERYVAGLVTSPAAPSPWLANCKVLLTPAGQARRPCALALADLVGPATGVTLKVTRNKLADLYASQYMFRDATVEARAGKKLLATFRVVEISGFGNPDSPTGGWDPIAVHWIRLVTDKDATARAKAGTLPTPPAIADAVAVPTGDDQDASDAASMVDDLDGALRGRADLRDQFASWVEDGAIVIGSAPGQTLSGKKGGKTLRGWKLELAQRGGLTVVAGGMVGVAVVDVVGTTKGKVPLTFTYPTMVVYTQGVTDAGSLISGPRLVSFAIAP